MAKEKEVAPVQPSDKKSFEDAALEEQVITSEELINEAKNVLKTMINDIISSTDDVPKELVAVTPILFESRLYRVGESLPAHNVEMVEAWLAAKTAKWREKETKHLKANPASATPGLAGIAVPASKEDLIGRIPER